MNENAVEFVTKLEIADLNLKDVPESHPFYVHLNAFEFDTFNFSPADEPVDNTKQAFLVKSGVASFVAGLSVQRKSDVLNACLLAELAADKQHDREADVVNWYKFYANVLENIGWVAQGFNFNKFDASGAEFSVDSVILEILAALVTGDELAVIQETINALKALSNNDGRLVLFETLSHSLSKGNFRIHSAVESDGIVVMNIGAFYFSSTENITKVLFFSFSDATTSFYQGCQSINLNLDIYNQVRDAIVQKLGDKAKDFVRNIQI